MFILQSVLIICLHASLSVCMVPFSYQPKVALSIRLFVFCSFVFDFVVRGLSLVVFCVPCCCGHVVRGPTVFPVFPWRSLPLSVLFPRVNPLSRELRFRGECGAGRGGGLHGIVGGGARPGAAGGGVLSRRFWWRLRSGAAGGGAWLGGAGGGVRPGVAGGGISGVAAGDRAVPGGAGDFDGLFGGVFELLFYAISDVQGLNDILFRTYLPAPLSPICFNPSLL